MGPLGAALAAAAAPPPPGSNMYMEAAGANATSSAFAYCGADRAHGGPTACELETAQAVLHGLLVLCVLHFVLSLLSHEEPQPQGGAGAPSRAHDRSFRTPDALRLGLSAAAVTNWLAAIIIRGLASMAADAMFPPYHTLLMVASVVAWSCYVALSIELDQVAPTDSSSAVYTAAKWCWLLGQLLLEGALVPTLMMGSGGHLGGGGRGGGEAGGGGGAGGPAGAAPAAAVAAAAAAGGVAATGTLDDLMRRFSSVLQLAINGVVVSARYPPAGAALHSAPLNSGCFPTTAD
eukprot:SAG22_NODE_62_length_23371_cov_84.500602_6_plen_291_part_00